MVFSLSALPLRRKHRTGYGVFVADVTLHELDAVPLLSGRFALSWRLQSHAAPRNALPTPDHTHYYPPIAPADTAAPLEPSAASAPTSASSSPAVSGPAPHASAPPSPSPASPSPSPPSPSLSPSPSPSLSPSLSPSPSPSSITPAELSKRAHSHHSAVDAIKHPTQPGSSEALAHGLTSVVPGMPRVHENDGLSLEPRGSTGFLPLKDYSVKVERTLRLGLRIPAERDAHCAVTAGMADIKALVDRAAGNNGSRAASTGSLHQSGSVPPSPATASMSLPSDSDHPAARPHSHRRPNRHHSSHPSERDRDPQKDLADAVAGYGTLAPTVLRISIKQKVDSDGLDQPIPVTNVNDKKDQKGKDAPRLGADSKHTLAHNASAAALRVAAPISSHVETTELGYIDLDLAEYAPWPREMAGAGLPCLPLTRHGGRGRGLHEQLSKGSINSGATMGSSGVGPKTPSSLPNHPSPDAVERTETRRYLLNESRTNARLLLSVTMRFVPAPDSPPTSNQGSSLTMWAVPKIQYGMTTGIGLGTLGMPNQGGTHLSRNESGLPRLLGLEPGTVASGAAPQVAAALLTMTDLRPTIRPPPPLSTDPHALVAGLFDEARAAVEAKHRARADRLAERAARHLEPNVTESSLPVGGKHSDMGKSRAKRLMHQAASLSTHHIGNHPSSHRSSSPNNSHSSSTLASPSQQHDSGSAAHKWKAITLALPTHLKQKASGDSHAPHTSSPMSINTHVQPEQPADKKDQEEREKVLTQSPVEIDEKDAVPLPLQRGRSHSFSEVEQGHNNHYNPLLQQRFPGQGASPVELRQYGAVPHTDSATGALRQAQAAPMEQGSSSPSRHFHSDTASLGLGEAPRDAAVRAGHSLSAWGVPGPDVGGSADGEDRTGPGADGSLKAWGVPPSKRAQTLEHHSHRDATHAQPQPQPQPQPPTEPDHEPQVQSQELGAGRKDRWRYEYNPHSAWGAPDQLAGHGISPSRAAKLGLHGAGWRQPGSPAPAPVVPANLV